MNYTETCNYLFYKTSNFESQGKGGYKEGLDTIKALDEHYEHPHHDFKTIHVAGTNGKGSVSHTLAAILQVCGYKVGLYTSPHLADFSERIRVNGQPIDQDYVTQFVESGKDFFEEIKATFFDITTIMAFSYFQEKDVDIAIIEVGLGGRLDSTNIITPLVSVITNISLDHTQLLGASVEQIAMEKAGIIKKGIPVVIGEAIPETRMVFDAIAQEANAPIVYAEDRHSIVKATMLNEGGMLYETDNGMRFKSELMGKFQEKNINTVAAVCQELMILGYLCDVKIPENVALIQKEMEDALMNVCELTGLQGRWQKIQDNPTIVCDTGHNIGAWEYLSKMLSEVKCNQMHIVFGMVEDKDIYGVMSLLPKNAIYYFTKGSTKRAMSERSLQVFGAQFELAGMCYPTVSEAIEDAMKNAQKDDFIFVGGSNYVVADFLKTRL